MTLKKWGWNQEWDFHFVAVLDGYREMGFGQKVYQCKKNPPLPKGLLLSSALYTNRMPSNLSKIHSFFSLFNFLFNPMMFIYVKFTTFEWDQKNCSWKNIVHHEIDRFQVFVCVFGAESEVNSFECFCLVPPNFSTSLSYSKNSFGLTYNLFISRF